VRETTDYLNLPRGTIRRSFAPSGHQCRNDTAAALRADRR